MENDTGEMYDLGEDVVGDVAPYLKENLDLFLMIHNGQVLSVILPATISYTIKSTVPGIKGDRSKTGKKPATLETGLEIQIPLHKSEGDTITVNTLT
jgi:elongation factor P